MTGTDLQTKGMLCDPGDHFKGIYEVERKYAVADLEVIRSQLEARGAVPFTLGNTEQDIFYDLADRRLANNNQQHVLRVMRPSGRALWISKGPGPDKCISMDMADADQTNAMILSLGFEEVERLEKKRDIYFLGKFHITLDEVPDLGRFVELAIMTDDADMLSQHEQEIGELANSFNLSSNALQTQSYRAMQQALKKA
ncbi:CYTH domain protein [Pseudovibrio sp. Ad46]|uniref:class IV adenylate cyclase n=1 Tax=unclassified Pseudovibrio TaxID=2627060 RepID=UPI00070B0B3F|nr:MULTISPECIES: class IV adenylate cyclase [unclassified Pseudovibrio]KZK90470.1 CYTH domain protein [Pseudovibrio sp. Ad46]KZK92808.1 CYTH domain protein [Pseudovibrio sp. Ad5]